MSNETDSVQLQPEDVFPQSIGHEKSLNLTTSGSKLRWSLPNVLPKTNYMDLFKERIENFPRRSKSDSLEDSTIAAEVADIAPQPRLVSTILDVGKLETDLLDKRGEKLRCFLKETAMWQEHEGFQFDDPSADENLKKFYIQANQLLIFGREIDVCSLCTRRKLKDKPRSHIFPEALLKLYATIHCRSETEFIYDQSDGQKKGAHSLSFPLFCDKCEVNASKEEHLLKTVYWQVQGSESSLEIEEKDVHILKHVLAILMFRGTLLGVNFFQEMLHDYCATFYNTFIELRDYCCENDCEVYKHKKISERIHLSLLPNSPFNKNNIDPSYILDLQLRNPEFTTVIATKSGVFLYTKFDCFHCTLPITPSDIDCLTKSSCFSYSDKGFYLFPTQTDGIQLFPQLLLNFNLSRMETLAYQLFIFNNSAFMTCKCVIQLLKMKKWEPFLFKSKQPIQESESVKITTQQLDESEMIKKASEKSPFVNYHAKGFEKVYDEELGKVTTAEEEKWKSKFKEKDEKFTQLIKIRKELSQDNNKLRKEIKQLKSENESLKNENEMLRKENESMKQLHQLDPRGEMTSPISSSPHIDTL